MLFPKAALASKGNLITYGKVKPWRLHHSLKMEKLGLIAPEIHKAVSDDDQIFVVDIMRAGAVAASILAAKTTSPPPV